MTNLEKRIYEHALKLIPKLLERIATKSYCADFIQFPFWYDGCWDFLIYDRQKGKFTQIEYMSGVGPATTLEGIENAGYFDNVELKYIDIP